MENVFVLPEKDVREIRKITSEIGFKNEEEFVKEAVEEKILEFNKIFFENTKNSKEFLCPISDEVTNSGFYCSVISLQNIKKLLFADITTDVRKGLEKKGVKQGDILRDFDRFRSK